jgi:hypothetical protein
MGETHVSTIWFSSIISESGNDASGQRREDKHASYENKCFKINQIFLFRRTQNQEIIWNSFLLSNTECTSRQSYVWVFHSQTKKEDPVCWSRGIIQSGSRILLIFSEFFGAKTRLPNDSRVLVKDQRLCFLSRSNLFSFLTFLLPFLSLSLSLSFLGVSVSNGTYVNATKTWGRVNPYYFAMVTPSVSSFVPWMRVSLH